MGRFISLPKMENSNLRQLACKYALLELLLITLLILYAPRFHQLHCLAYFRKTLQRAHAGEDVGLDWEDNSHWPHCFLYLRQAILCSADDNLEYPQVVDGVLTHTISGMHDVRKCGNSQQLYDFRDKWSINNFNITEED
jgi:hypothetical protein